MRVSREQAEENRWRVVSQSSRLFRERGFDGIGIADLMKAAGLTVGGFYKQFDSKEALAQEACRAALAETDSLWQRLRDDPSPAGLERFLRSYLSPTHRDAMTDGCLLAALAPEAARRDDRVRAVFGEAIETYVAAIAGALRETDEAHRRSRALAILAQMVGALSLSRAAPDEAMSNELLATSLVSLLTLVREPTRSDSKDV